MNEGRLVVILLVNLLRFARRKFKIRRFDNFFAIIFCLYTACFDYKHRVPPSIQWIENPYSAYVWVFVYVLLNKGTVFDKNSKIKVLYEKNFQPKNVSDSILQFLCS